jgi:hypothetical protein
MPSSKNLLLVCYCRKGERASHNLLGALSDVGAMTLPGTVLKVEKVEVGTDSDLMGSRRVTGSPVLDVIIDGELAGRFYGERNAEELRSIVHELLAEGQET